MRLCPGERCGDNSLGDRKDWGDLDISGEFGVLRLVSKSGQ